MAFDPVDDDRKSQRNTFLFQVYDTEPPNVLLHRRRGQYSPPDSSIEPYFVVIMALHPLTSDGLAWSGLVWLSQGQRGLAMLGTRGLRWLGEDA